MRQCLQWLVVGCLLLGVGCAHTSQVPFHYDSEGMPISYRRRALHLERDFLHNFRTEAYRKPKPGEFESRRQLAFAPGDVPATSEDEARTLDLLGEPDFIREFKSVDREDVVEWLYLDQALVQQYIDGRLIFEGPLTDYEQVLLTQGFPTSVISQRDDAGRQTDLFVYTGIFLPALRQYYFVDGYVMQFQEGH